MAVVEVLNRQAAKDPLNCHQLRSLFYISTRFDFDVVARHTPGVANVRVLIIAAVMGRRRCWGTCKLPEPADEKEHPSFLSAGSGSHPLPNTHPFRVGYGHQCSIPSVEIARLDSLARLYFGQALASSTRRSSTG